MRPFAPRRMLAQGLAPRLAPRGMAAVHAFRGATALGIAGRLMREWPPGPLPEMYTAAITTMLNPSQILRRCQTARMSCNRSGVLILTESGRGVFVTKTGNVNDAVLPDRVAKNLAKGGAIRFLERIPQKLTDFCDENSLQFLDLARFLIARPIPAERKAR